MKHPHVQWLRPWCLILMAIDIMSWVGVIPRFYYGGFYCNDPAIQHKRQPQSIRGLTVILGCAVIGYGVLLIGEWCRPSATKRSLRLIMKSTHRWYKDFALGYVLIMFVSELIKNLVTAPRPDFMDVCQPNITCVASEYVSVFECTSSRTGQEKNDALKSFPSGHAGSAVFTALYLMAYLHMTAGSHWPRVARVVVELGLITWGIVTSASRISDHRHHVRDVMGGIILAFLAAYWTVVCVSEKFREMEVDDETDDARPITRTSQKRLLSDSEKNGSLRSRGAHGGHELNSLTSAQ